VSRAVLILSAASIGIIAGFASFEVARAQSAKVCDAYARQYSEKGSRQGQVLGRGAVGSLIGLGIGAATGDAGAGAAIGATIGGIGGGAERKRTAEKMYAAAYRDCMSGQVR
jgi:outer membrane lipoprotein SlyB